jgi:hypothetical protein
MPGICDGVATPLRNDHIVPIAAEGLETERVDPGTAEPKRDDVEAKEMAAMRPERRARPAALFELGATGDFCGYARRRRLRRADRRVAGLGGGRVAGRLSKSLLDLQQLSEFV